MLIFLIQKISAQLLLYGDTFQHWAAGRLLLSGDNPYDDELVNRLRIIAGYEDGIDGDAISMMLYPPWIFPILIPLAIFSYSTSRLLWLFFHILIIFLAARTLWKIYGGQKKYEYLAYLVAFSFTPTFYVLGIGHITPLHLIGIVIFLYFINEKNWRSDLIAGYFISFILLKPQLLIIYFFAVSLWLLSTRRWFVLFGILIFVLLNTSIALAFNQNVLYQYIEAILAYPMETWATPTQGTLLRLLFGIDKSWLQILPAIIGSVWVLFFWLKKRATWNWRNETPLLLLVSFVFSPYMWVYDMVVLALPIIYMFIIITNADVKIPSVIYPFLYLVINVYAFLMHRTRADYWFFWLAPVLLIWFYITEKSVSKSLKVRRLREANIEEIFNNPC